MKDKTSVRPRWRLSPPVIVTVTMLAVIALVIAANFISARRHRFRASVEITDPPLDTPAPQPRSTPAPIVLPDGEVARTAVRVREASALVTGLTLLAVSEALARRSVPDGGTLLRRLAERRLLPPGVRLSPAPGMLESECALMQLRYRPEPLAVEIVSTGRERSDGPPIIACIATGERKDAGAALFIARGLDGVSLPAPFTPATEMAALNRSVEPLRERTLTARELAVISDRLKAP